MEIYTIGHSNYAIERFLEMLKKYDINCVVDTRATPYSKYNTQFDKEMIKHTLNKNGIVYIYMLEFAAKRENKGSYNKEGYSDFEKAVEEDEFKNGVERIKRGYEKGYRIALLGAMQEPIRCQRGILLGRELTRYGIEVKHIMDDNTVASQQELEQQLLNKYFKDRNQITIESLLGNGLTEEEMIREAYRKANREIGFRIEGLGKP